MLMGLTDVRAADTALRAYLCPVGAVHLGIGAAAALPLVLVWWFWSPAGAMSECTPFCLAWPLVT